jgi:hypothetical protein
MVLALVAIVPATALMAYAPHPSVLGYAMLVGQQLVADPLGTLGLVAFGTAIASGSPDPMRARVESTIAVLATIGTAVGFVTGGLLGESSVGTAGALMIGAGASAAAAVCLSGRRTIVVQPAAPMGSSRHRSTAS